MKLQTHLLGLEQIILQFQIVQGIMPVAQLITVAWQWDTFWHAKVTTDIL